MDLIEFFIMMAILTIFGLGAFIPIIKNSEPDAFKNSLHELHDIDKTE